ncbi:MAG: aldo/keto reductase [Candidatus Promineifilaceae bacterium]|nr:aldo/keto reductase [Candidatus Promineifilaceae bacterium]
MTKARKLDDPRLVAMIDEAGKSPAQVLIRFGLQQGAVVLAKSANRDRIRANYDVFDFSLSDEQMVRLESFNEQLIIVWNPVNAP